MQHMKHMNEYAEEHYLRARAGELMRRHAEEELFRRGVGLCFAPAHAIANPAANRAQPGDAGQGAGEGEGEREE